VSVFEEGRYASLRDSKNNYNIYEIVGRKGLDELSPANDAEDSPLQDLNGRIAL
jgi:hypothetical protein